MKTLLYYLGFWVKDLIKYNGPPNLIILIKDLLGGKKNLNNTIEIIELKNENLTSPLS
jgi:hypothetical protein